MYTGDDGVDVTAYDILLGSPVYREGKMIIYYIIIAEDARRRLIKIDRRASHPHIVISLRQTASDSPIIWIMGVQLVY